MMTGHAVRHQTEITDWPGKRRRILDCPERVLLECKVRMPRMFMGKRPALSLKVTIDTSDFPNLVQELLKMPELLAAGMLLLGNPSGVRLHGYRCARFSGLILCGR
jgi:hypothetical protein